MYAVVYTSYRLRSSELIILLIYAIQTFISINMQAAKLVPD
jgi:hypothetical protein